MRVFLNKPFQRFARKERISDDAICEAVARAERGLIDADLGGGVIKQRIPRPGEGRSGGFRSIILYRSRERAFFVYGFPKNQLENITESELQDLKILATEMLAYDERRLQAMIGATTLREVTCDEQNLQE